MASRGRPTWQCQRRNRHQVLRRSDNICAYGALTPPPKGATLTRRKICRISGPNTSSADQGQSSPGIIGDGMAGRRTDPECDAGAQSGRQTTAPAVSAKEYSPDLAGKAQA